MKLENLVREHGQEWPMFMTAEDRQKMLREKLERAVSWSQSIGFCVADILEECYCEQHR